ncbi:MAG TPA: phosphotransferase [Steroidobacteraceae bacterium]
MSFSPSIAGSSEAVGPSGLLARVRALHSPETYPDPAVDLESIETHFAWVFLVGELAYKLKKPVKNGRLDLRELEARRWSCEEEVRLNRVLAPDVYLGVVPLVCQGDRFRIGGEGVIVDWLVKMRRLPRTLMLDRAIRTGTVAEPALEALGRRLAGFYQTQPHIAFEPEQYICRIAEQIHADRRALLAPELNLHAHCLRAALRATWCAFSQIEPELVQRALENRIVEAHGDLRPEHICLEDPPCVIDSLEFSKDLRTLDPAEELAFLWVECEQEGDERPAKKIFDAYRRASGDPVSERLLDFYRSRRAMVRAKIVAWHLNDPAVMHQAPWAERADGYIKKAERYALRAMGTDPDDDEECGPL